MRAISLIVVHCSATREDKSFTEHDLDVCHRRRGSTVWGIIFIFARMGTSNRPVLSNASVRTPVASTVKVSVSAMKVVWTAGDARQTHGHRHNGLHYGNW